MSILNTSVSGMLADSNWLATISQNVANANTTAYKDSETEFSTVVDQLGSAAASGGVTTSTLALNTQQGNVVGTSTTTDLAVQGDGYFVVSNSSGDLFLTRNGSFVPDSNGNLVNSAGYYLMGQNVQNGAAAGSSNSTSDLTVVNVTTSGELSTPTTTGTLSTNLDSTATPVTTAADLPSANGAGATYTSETSLTTYNDLGGKQSVNVYYTNLGYNSVTGTDQWEVTAYNAADASTSAGFPYTAGGVAGATADNPLVTATLNFNPNNGQLSGITGESVNGVATTVTGSNLTLTVPNGQPMTLDLTGTTQLSAAFVVNSSVVNGNAAGTLSGLSVGTNGTLDFQYSNGASSPAYDIPLATVPSEDNLTAVSGNAYTVSEASGNIRLGTPGAAGLGTIASSSLESSTVDLATELTNMIEAQSAYQASSKAFQAGVTVLDVLNNLKS
ncbi:MAG TPA: flagellar hook protein FlgE [Roseiarcus sp.]|jgi:flagellar hook protein FlgE